MHRSPPISRTLTRWARRSFTLTTLGSALGLVGVGLGAGIQACSSDSKDATSGKRVLLHTRVAVDQVATAEFTSAVGWNVTLTQAFVSAGPFYYFDGAPPLVLRQARKTWEYASRLLGLGVAHAHPGHYQAGNAMGQMIEPVNIDLLGGSVDLPDGDGVTGSYRSARFTFAEPAGAGSKALDGHAALALGKAEKAGEIPRFFQAFADLSAIEKSASLGHIEGCEFSEADVEGDGTVTVTVNPKIWFDLVDFTDADAGSADAPADLPADSQPQIAFVLGVTQLSAYKFSYTSP
jgi:hypothetical protein